MIISDAALRAEANNLTLVRLVLSSAVIFSHCYGLIHGAAAGDSLAPILGVPVSVYAVDGFFFLSGFLVYPSLIKRNRVGSFVAARLTRLWPGLAVSVLLTILVGLFVTTATPTHYFTGQTARFALGNLSLLFAGFYLTGVQCGDALCTINGSLWTLPREAQCYAILALLFVFGLAGRRTMIRLVLPATVAFALLWHVPGMHELARRLGGGGVVYVIDAFDRLWVLFAAGIAASLFRDRIRLSWWVLAALFPLTLAAEHGGFGLHVRTLFIGYAVLCCGFLSARRGAISARWPDYSYGIYIYAFPVMMAVHALWPTDNYLVLAAANLAATLPFAIFSWHLIEHPMLNLVRRRRTSDQTDAASAAVGREMIIPS